MKSRFEQSFRLFLKATIFFDHTVIHLGVAKEPMPLQALMLNHTRRHNTLTNRFGGLCPARSMKIRIGHTRHTDMKIDTVKQRS